MNILIVTKNPEWWNQHPLGKIGNVFLNNEIPQNWDLIVWEIPNAMLDVKYIEVAYNLMRQVSSTDKFVIVTETKITDDSVILWLSTQMQGVFSKDTFDWDKFAETINKTLVENKPFSANDAGRVGYLNLRGAVINGTGQSFAGNIINIR